MSTQSLKNISIKTFKQFLSDNGCTNLRTNAGHEVWSSNDLLRPIVFQTHIDPIPEFIIKNNLRIMGLNPQRFYRLDYQSKIICILVL